MCDYRPGVPKRPEKAKTGLHSNTCSGGGTSSDQNDSEKGQKNGPTFEHFDEPKKPGFGFVTGIERILAARAEKRPETYNEFCWKQICKKSVVCVSKPDLSGDDRFMARSGPEQPKVGSERVKNWQAKQLEKQVYLAHMPVFRQARKFLETGRGGVEKPRARQLSYSPRNSGRIGVPIT